MVQMVTTHECNLYNFKAEKAAALTERERERERERDECNLYNFEAEKAAAERERRMREGRQTLGEGFIGDEAKTNTKFSVMLRKCYISFLF